MNYTRPDEIDYQDDPKDWLNSALILTRAMSLILKENEGIVVDIKGDVEFQLRPAAKKVIAYKKNKMVHIIKLDEDLEEGTWIWMGTDIATNEEPTNN